MWYNVYNDNLGGFLLNIQESGEMYLESILVLSKKSTHVRSIDICEYMGFSKPSVSRAVNLLKQNGFIDIDTFGYITLTQKGENHAKKIYERHNILKNFLINVGVNPETASIDACKMEHCISDETFTKLKEYIDQK